MSRKIISVPAIVALVLLLAWFTILRSLFAPVPVDGKWHGKGDGQLLSIDFTVEDSGRFATNVIVAFGPSGRSVMTIQSFTGKYEIKGGEFTVQDDERSNTTSEIQSVFSSPTDASGYVDIEERISETTYTREGPRGTMMPSYYSGISLREGKWTARIESQ